jgi:hypothetical protein
MRVRGWCGTLNNPTADEVATIVNLNSSDIEIGIFAVEKGKSDTTHIQAYWEFKNAKTMSATKKIMGKRWHLEKRRGSKNQAWVYCLKDGDIMHQVGEEPKAFDSQHNQWSNIREMIENGASDMEICAIYPQEGMRCRTAIRNYRLMWQRAHADWRNVDVVYIWGKTGTGKTRSINEKYGYPNVFRITDYNSGSFDMYDGQDVIMFEEFRSSFRLEKMLNYLDGHPVELPCRYANQIAQYTKVFIVTNIPLDEQYDSFHDGYESEGKRNSWEAFTRRISGIIEVKEGQTLTAVDLPLLGEELEEFFLNAEEE